MADLTVAFAKADLLNRLAKKQELLTSTAIKRLIGSRFKALVKECFDQSRDPYGNPWKPLAYRIGKPLILTGALRGSIKSRNTADDVEVYTDVFYGKFHQGGYVSRVKARQQPTSGRTGRFIKRPNKSSKVVRVPGGLRAIPARPFFPDGRGMPPSWRKRVRDDIRLFTKQGG